jgi:hypothetical protein
MLHRCRFDAAVQVVCEARSIMVGCGGRAALEGRRMQREQMVWSGEVKRGLRSALGQLLSCSFTEHDTFLDMKVF